MNTSPNVHFPGVLRALARQHITHHVIDATSLEEKALIDWTEKSFPWGFSRIDWDKVTSHRCTEWTEVDELVAAFEKLASEFSPATLVVVMWANALCPSLGIALGDVKKIAREIFEEHETSIDVLVCCQAEGWLIEMHHEGALCIGFAGQDLDASARTTTSA